MVAQIPSVLTAEQVEQFNTQGYLVVPDLLTHAEVDAFLDHLAREPAIGSHGLQGHRHDPQYRYLATARACEIFPHFLVIPMHFLMKISQARSKLKTHERS